MLKKSKAIPSICFYIPQQNETNLQIPYVLDQANINDYLQSIRNQQKSVSGTVYNWILQTYLWLKADGFPCTLLTTLPQEGVVITYWGSIPIEFKPSSKLMVVSVLADGFYPHPYAQLRVVQNYQQVLAFRNSHHILHWPQPGLIPRCSSRGTQFENIAYFGDASNLAPELKSLSWQTQLQSLGLNWSVIDEPQLWHDYGKIDVVLAVRSFEKRNYFNKPATKLYNAWHAGVPAILGRESAYQFERKSELDYIEVSSPDEIIAALRRLCDKKELRHAMIENGRVRAEETSIKNLTAKWCNFITQEAIPAYEAWCSMTYLSKQSFIVQRFLAKKIDGVKHRFHKVSPLLQKG
ncbi:MAG: hypothetical protein JO235_05670 [Chroococcidiopsidaceae cyanobacterium CP_BM_RX_35]|nr:hypothetical protein [Chroococcidiopsidaceae cyanobacterium CP_BM_RX_35]